MNFDGILYAVEDGVGTITFNRPNVNNGFNIAMCEEILAAIKSAEEDENVKVVLINSSGKVFSVGGDLVEMQRAVEDDDIHSLVRIAELVKDISFAIKRLPKPVVMSTNGPVAGAAFNMALAADFCVASTNTRFIQAFVNVGLAPDAGGLFLLTRAVGVTRAAQMVMTGEGVNAEKAHEFGFVYRVTEPEELDKHTNRLVTKLKKGPANSYRAMKQMVWQAMFQNWEEYVNLEVKLQTELAFTEDFKEGVRAFTERRRPKFTGK